MTTVLPYGLEIFESRPRLRDADGAAYRHVRAVHGFVTWLQLRVL